VNVYGGCSRSSRSAKLKTLFLLSTVRTRERGNKQSHYGMLRGRKSISAVSMEYSAVRYNAAIVSAIVTYTDALY
jgi:hypothetical protein